MRIGIIVPHDFIKRRPYGGAGGFLQGIVEDFGVELVVFGIGVNGSEAWRRSDVGSQVVFIPVADVRYPTPVPHRLKAFIVYALNRERIFRQKTDMLYIHSWECALPFLFFNKHVPVVFHQHGSSNPVERSIYKWARNGVLIALFDNMLKIIHRRADWVIAIDQLCLAQAQSNGAGSKVSLIMNAVDTKQYRFDDSVRLSVRRRYGVKEKETVLLFVGRIEKVKRLDKILASVWLIKKAGIGCRLLVAGTGSLKKECEQYVEENGIQPAVTFLGYVPPSDLPQYYNAADVLVLASETEGTPMVALEALACGTPVIAPNVGGLTDLIVSGINGLLLEDASPKKIASAIVRLGQYDFPREQIADTVGMWSSEKVVCQLEKIFANVIEKKRADI